MKKPARYLEPIFPGQPQWEVGALTHRSSSGRGRGDLAPSGPCGCDEPIVRKCEGPRCRRCGRDVPSDRIPEGVA